MLWYPTKHLFNGVRNWLYKTRCSHIYKLVSVNWLNRIFFVWNDATSTTRIATESSDPLTMITVRALMKPSCISSTSNYHAECQLLGNFMSHELGFGISLGGFSLNGLTLSQGRLTGVQGVHVQSGGKSELPTVAISRFGNPRFSAHINVPLSNTCKACEREP